MRKVKFIFLCCLSLCGFSFSSHGVGPYYQLNFDKLEDAKSAINVLEKNNPIDIKTYDCSLTIFRQTCNDFLSACESAKRRSATDLQNNIERDSYQSVFTDAGYAPFIEKVLPLHKIPQRSIEEMLNIVGSSNKKNFVEEVQEHIQKKKVLLPLYQEYVEFYGPWREWRFRSCIGLPSSYDTPEIREKKKLIFDTLVKSGFIATHQIDFKNAFEPDPMIMLSDFLDKNPDINELRLGDEKTLCRYDHKILGTPNEGIFGLRAFSKEDISPHIMRISNVFAENNDITSDAHNSAFWEALINIKGEGSFVRIKDLSWYIFGILQNKDSDECGEAINTLKFIHKTLKPGGEFSLWDHAFEGQNETYEATGKLREDEKMTFLIKHVTNVGFAWHPDKCQKDTLVFRKK